jgi:hypothetical protein
VASKTTHVSLIFLYAIVLSSQYHPNARVLEAHQEYLEIGWSYKRNFRCDLGGDVRTNPVDRIQGYPTINSANIIANLKSITLYGFDQMQILAPIYFAKDNIPFFQDPVAQRFNCDQLPRFDLAFHGIAPGTELNGLSLP